MIEVDTIGNATLILSEDGKPLLATDVGLTKTLHISVRGHFLILFLVSRETSWLNVNLFISHFHPDHLNLASLRHFKAQYSTCTALWISR